MARASTVGVYFILGTFLLLITSSKAYARETFPETGEHLLDKGKRKERSVAKLKDSKSQKAEEGKMYIKILDRLLQLKRLLPQAAEGSNNKLLRRSGAIVEFIFSVLSGLYYLFLKPPALKQPHIITIILDDWGWNNWSQHANKQDNRKEIRTPTLDRLASQGIVLDRHYVARICSPSRCAFQTGRNPIYVNTLNDQSGNYNLDDPVSGFSGIPRNMTVIAEKLAAVNYSTIYVGKWHVGLATPQHTPQGRGYQKSLIYFFGNNDYWTYSLGPLGNVSYAAYCNPANITVTDLWQDDQPAYQYKPAPECLSTNQSNCLYEDELFADTAVNHIMDHDMTKPMFMVWSPHIVHGPLTPPTAYDEKFAYIDVDERRSYAAMVYYIDQQIQRVVNTLKLKGMWGNSLILVTADNGGNLVEGANNYPLRGGRSNLEGGVRSNALVSGGYIPRKMRGKKSEAFIGIEDWYATFCALAGADPFDNKAQQAGLPPVGSHNMWPVLSGENSTSPRDLVILSAATPLTSVREGTSIAQAVIDREGYKLIIGISSDSFFQGPFYPNSSSNVDAESDIQLDCGGETPVYPYSGACLFNVFDDPTEHVNLAAANPSKVSELVEKIKELNDNTFSPNRGSRTWLPCENKLNKYQGFVGPFLS